MTWNHPRKKSARKCPHHPTRGGVQMPKNYCPICFDIWLENREEFLDRESEERTNDLKRLSKEELAEVATDMVNIGLTNSEYHIDPQFRYYHEGFEDYFKRIRDECLFVKRQKDL